MSWILTLQAIAVFCVGLPTSAFAQERPATNPFEGNLTAIKTGQGLFRVRTRPHAARGRAPSKNVAQIRRLCASASSCLPRLSRLHFQTRCSLRSEVHLYAEFGESAGQNDERSLPGRSVLVVQREDGCRAEQIIEVKAAPDRRVDL